jgi:hypothetical protein
VGRSARNHEIQRGTVIRAFRVVISGVSALAPRRPYRERFSPHVDSSRLLRADTVEKAVKYSH